MNNIAYIFSGQGSQYVGMGKDIYNTYPEGRFIFEQASDALGLNLKRLCFQDPDEKLRLTTYTQPAILTTSLSLWVCLGKPDSSFFAGHSLGEFTALVAGGALELSDAVTLVRDRGRFMQEAVPSDIGGMAALIGLTNKEVEDICSCVWAKGRVWPANYNCPGQIVIAGEKKGLIKAVELAKKRGAKHTLILSISIPSHCPMMQEAAGRFNERLKNVNINNLKIPIISNCWAVPIKDKHMVRENMVRQMTSSVLWEDCIRLMIKKGINTFIEIGPGKILSGLIRKINRDVKTMNVSDVRSIERLWEIRR